MRKMKEKAQYPDHEDVQKLSIFCKNPISKHKPRGVCYPNCRQQLLLEFAVEDISKGLFCYAKASALADHISEGERVVLETMYYRGDCIEYHTLYPEELDLE